jgi:outer membrane biogenesis lipoprotein LolB
MVRLISAVVAALAAFALAGCLSTQEMPLAPNVVRIDTQAGGWLFTGQTVPATMRAAAKATLDRGYSHFKFTDASLGQSSVVTGTVGSGNTNVSGNYGGGFMNANATSFGSTSVVRAPTAGAAVTVVMFHANEPGAQGAFVAEQILKQYSQ